MNKYLSKDELDTFEFHDSKILSAIITDNSLIIVLKYLNVLVENSKNEYPTAMEIDEAKITFKEFKFKELIKIHPIIDDISKREKVYFEDTKIVSLLSDGDVTDYFSEIDKEARFDFFGKNPPYDFFHIAIGYSEVIVEWNAMIKKAWFVRD